jgi:hypothetical protein
MSDDLPDAPWATGSQASDLPDAPWSTPSTGVGTDVAKSAGVGLGKGLINTAGSVGDITDLGAKGIETASNYISDALGIQRYERPKTPSVLNNIPTSESLQKRVEGVTGQFYQPQTTAGKFAGAIGETAGNPLSYVGPGGLAGKIAGAVATGAGSEGAGELAQKYAPEAEPYARIAGGLLGGAAAGTASAAVENTMRARGISTTQDLRNAADTAYGNARALPVERTPGQLAILRDQIRRDLIKQGHRADKSGGTFSRIEELPDPPTPEYPGGNRTFSDIEGVRQSLRDIAGEVDARGMRTADARAATRAIDRIDDFLEDPSKAVAGHQGLAAQQADFAREGRENWGAMARSQQIEAALARGQRNADSAGTGSNVDNTLRQQVKQILNNPRRAKNFTNDDRQIMEDIVAGNPIRNSARLISKLAATGIVSATGVLALGHLMGLGPYASGALPVIGEGTRRLGIAMTRNRYGRLLENIRMDSAVGRANPIGPRASAAPAIARAAATTPGNQRLYVSPGNPYAP